MPIRLGAMVALLAWGTPLSAQTDAIVRGRVVAAADGSVLPQAEVILTPVADGVSGVAQASSMRALTDTQGHFVFAAVRPAEYIAAVSASGFARKELRLTVEPRDVSVVAFELDVAGVNVDISVRADGPALPSTHSPSSTVLTRERLDAVAVFQRTGLPEAIVTSAPGMIRGHDDFVHVRGHEIALNPLIDGIGFWENTHSVFSAGLSPEVIESANVMTGAFPAEYGNRFGGVIDIVTKSGLRTDQRGSLAIGGGGAGRRGVEGDVSGRRGTFGYYVFGSVLTSDRFLSPPDPTAIHDSATGGHLFARLDHATTSRGAFNGVVMADGIDMQIPKTPLDEELRPWAEGDQRTRQQTATFGWTRASEHSVVSAAAYERWSQLRLLPADGPLTAHADVTRELLTVGTKADATRLSGRHTIKIGLEGVLLRPTEDLFYDYSGYRDFTHLVGWPHIHLTGPIAFADRDTGGQISAFAQDTMQLGTRTSLDAGVRIDRHALVTTDTHVSPRLNLAVRAGAGSVLHASYNHFFVPPAIEGVLSSSAGLTESIREIGVPLPALRATVENQFEAGASAPWGPLSLALTGYFRATDNPVHTTVWPDSRIYSYASFDRARAYGLEAKLAAPGLSRRGASVYLNYALGRVEFFNPATGGFITEADHLIATDKFLAPMDQTHTLTGGATYRHSSSGIWAGMSVEYGSGTPIGHEDTEDSHGEDEAGHTHVHDIGTAPRVPQHFLGNLSIGVDVFRNSVNQPRLTLRVDVENVGNNLYLIAQDSEFSPAQYSIPRLVSLTARVRF